jgi:hypothetical protein
VGREVLLTCFLTDASFDFLTGKPAAFFEVAGFGGADFDLTGLAKGLFRMVLRF